jgi:hypothetical protein
MSGEQSEQELATEAKRGRGRLPGFRMTEEHRAKIRNSNILNALLEHIEGNRDMSATQVTAGLGLLKKALPDLQAITLNGDDDGDPIRVVGKIERVIVNPKD